MCHVRILAHPHALSIPMGYLRFSIGLLSCRERLSQTIEVAPTTLLSHTHLFYLLNPKTEGFSSALYFESQSDT